MLTKYQSILTSDGNARVIIQTAIIHANKQNKEVKRRINGIEITVTKHSNVEGIFQDYKIDHYFANN